MNDFSHLQLQICILLFIFFGKEPMVYESESLVKLFSCSCFRAHFHTSSRNATRIVFKDTLSSVEKDAAGKRHENCLKIKLIDLSKRFLIDTCHVETSSTVE